MSIEGTQAITSIRAAQRTYLKNSSRFPEFIDVGYDVFQSVIDWLVAVRQPVTISRLGDGRYTVGAVCVDHRVAAGLSGQTTWGRGTTSDASPIAAPARSE